MTEAGILIVGGGTGGHISPGLALYEEFRARKRRVLFLVGKKDSRFISKGDIEQGDLMYYGAPGFTRNVFKLPVFGIRFCFALLKAMRILHKERIKAVIGMGGYVSAPALAAAVIKKIPLYLCEQNTVPGKVTMLFAKKSARIFATFEETREYLPYEIHGCMQTPGNPIRKKVFTDIDRDNARKAFNLRHCRRVILAIGGSQGAVAINDLVYGLRTRFSEELNGVGIIWSTGEYSYRKFKEAVQSGCDYGSIYLSPYIDDVGTAYRACDIAISRSGSGVMMELAAMGIPSVLIPYPYAAMDHQDRNADVFERAGAAVKVPNRDAVPEKVAPILGDLLNNETRLERMAKKARAIGKPAAAADIASVVTGDITAVNKEQGGVQKIK